MKAPASRPKMLFVGDAVAPTGFSKATHAYLDGVKDAYDLTVLGINYNGDPHAFPYPIYAAHAGGDMMGILRLVWMCDLVTHSRQEGQHRVFVPDDEARKPDVIVIQQDPWNFPDYLAQLTRKTRTYDGKEFADVPVIGIVAVDALNCRGDWLNGLAMAIFWTKFGQQEAIKGGYAGPSTVLPLGVDLRTYYPDDRIEARRKRGLDPRMHWSFIVGNVNRNQPRKRFDLTLRAFAQWVHAGPLKDAYLYLHVAPTGELGVDVPQLVDYYHLHSRVLVATPQAFYGVTEADMRDTYNVFDVQLTTTQGEGFGLTTLEGMACGVPQIGPDWSALACWAREGMHLVPCQSTAINVVAPGLNTIGGVADVNALVAAIDVLYRDRAARAALGGAGLRLAHEDRFRWAQIGEAFRLTVNCVLRPVAARSVAVEEAIA